MSDTAQPVLHYVQQPERGDPVNHPDLVFFCPGCRCGHGIWTTRENHSRAKWKWNGSMDKPTFAPSLLVAPDADGKTPGIHRCHSFVRDGQIQFLNDCTHALKGKTVALEPF